MIKNEKQYKITKGWLKKFEQGKQKLSKLPKGKEQPWLREAQLGSAQAQIDQFKEELAEYEALKSGKIKLPRLTYVATLPGLLIKKRINNGWTSKQLAKRLDLDDQQIQRYENTDYATATLETIQKIASVLEHKTTKNKTKAAALRVKK